jgi:cytochrome d ubiquinol oxidase subunit II
LDVYTVLVGLFAVVAVTAHGAAFLAWRLEGPLRERARRTMLRWFAATAVLWPLLSIATHRVNPALLSAFPSRPLAWLGLVVALAGIVVVFAAGTRQRPLAAFLGSSGFLAGLLVATAACLFPTLLPSRTPGVGPLTAYNAGATELGLRTAFGWWRLGIPLVIAYFAILFWVHRKRAGTPARS